MAQRRMFSLKIIDTDAFMDMSLSAQALYLHLLIRADDDGFVGNPKKILRMIGGQDDDMKLLFVKRFIIGFESGVCVIKHWKIHNYIQSDRYNKTTYNEEAEALETKENGSYTECIQNVSKMDTQVRLGKVSIGKKRGGFTPPSISELKEFIKENNYNVDPETFINHYETVGWMVGKNKMKDWKASVRGWHSRNKDTPKTYKSSRPRKNEALENIKRWEKELEEEEKYAKNRR